jgi:hypothetical protein
MNGQISPREEVKVKSGVSVKSKVMTISTKKEMKRRFR